MKWMSSSSLLHDFQTLCEDDEEVLGIIVVDRTVVHLLRPPHQRFDGDLNLKHYSTSMR